MGFLDRITGKRAAGSPSGEQAAEAGPSQAEFLAEAVPAASAAQADQLREAIPSFTPSASATTSGDGGQRLYNPYEVCYGKHASIACRAKISVICHVCPSDERAMFSHDST